MSTPTDTMDALDRETMEKLIQDGPARPELKEFMGSAEPGGPDDPKTQADPRYHRAKAMRKQKIKVRKICQDCGISMSTYYQWFPKIAGPAQDEEHQRTVTLIQKLRSEGLTDVQISTRLKKS